MKEDKKKKNHWLNISTRNGSSPGELQPSRQRWLMKDLPSDKAFFQLNKTWCLHPISYPGVSSRQLLVLAPPAHSMGAALWFLQHRGKEAANPHQLRPPSPFWSHWSNKPGTTTSFDCCFQVSFEPERPRKRAQAFASLPGIWTGQKIPAVQTRAGDPFLPEITVVVGSSLMGWLFRRAELILCPAAFGGSISSTPWTAAEVRGGLEDVRVGSRSPSERIPAAPHNQHPPDALPSTPLPLH